MATFTQGAQQRQLIYGTQVTKSWTLPASATTSTLFTVTGGPAVVTSFIGRVTTLIGSTPTSLTLGTTATGGTAATDGIATGATLISGMEVGTFVGPQATATLYDDLVVGQVAGQALWLAGAFVVNTGTITATTSANAGAGVIKWYLTYVPLETGAAIAAA